MTPTDLKSLASHIPDVDALLGMDEPELGRVLLRIASRSLQQGMFQPANVVDHRGLPHDTIDWGKQPASAWSIANPRPPEYPPERMEEVKVALGEVWNWLEQNGFIFPAPGANGAQGWKMLTRKGQAEVEAKPVPAGAVKGSFVAPAPVRAGPPK